jgi:hypothetical protein
MLSKGLTHRCGTKLKTAARLDMSRLVPARPKCGAFSIEDRSSELSFSVRFGLGAGIRCSIHQCRHLAQSGLSQPAQRRSAFSRIADPLGQRQVKGRFSAAFQTGYGSALNFRFWHQSDPHRPHSEHRTTARFETFSAARASMSVFKRVPDCDSGGREGQFMTPKQSLRKLSAFSGWRLTIRFYC